MTFSAPELKAVAEIFAIAVKSQLGMFGFLVLLFSGITLKFFGKANEKLRIVVWFALFAGLLSFGFSLGQTSELNTQHIFAYVLGPDMKPLYGAHVSAARAAAPTTTDSHGVFHLYVRSKPGDPVRVRVEADGYKPVEETFTPPVAGTTADIILVK
ncbi:carboxypeptidase regulatory-like domain-containing protein [Edaphobacter bradus]|uniref:carboxypeptidase regulatory-like domain-containing protein n=1 Tax=Edaphobacter bradus TaxID=2259016 RepID=UPI0021E0133C|nr:carboxypeptidase regulatory-like domain-containing protein [Edaphobacter bradus]